ncbi:unnamed protein product, partial [Rotaria socialis]
MHVSIGMGGLHKILALIIITYMIFNHQPIPGRAYTVAYNGKSPYLAVLHGSVLRS